MSDYLRTTRACQFGELRPELIASLLAHAEKIGLPDLTVSVVACCETRNLKKKKGLFAGLGGDPDPEHFVGAPLTATWLI